MRSLGAAIFSLVIGTVFAVLGIILALWVGLAVYRVELAFDCVLWAVEHSPLPLTVSPLVLANDAIQKSSLIPAGIGAAFLCWIGFSSLRSARDSLRPADESTGGKARIVLKTGEPRVGRPLEGRLRLLEDPQPGQVFRLVLSCCRTYRSDGGDRKATVFSEQKDVAAVQGAEGWSVPFRFDVPATAPPTTERSFLSGSDGYGWLLAFYPADALVAVASEVWLTLGPAPAEEIRALPAAGTAEQKEAIKVITQRLGRSLRPHELAQLRGLSSEDLAMAQKVSGMPKRFAMKLIKWVFIVFFVLPFLLFILAFAATMFFRQ